MEWFISAGVTEVGTVYALNARTGAVL